MNNKEIDGRFWVPRGEPIQVDEHGYTIFSRGKWRPLYNPNVLSTLELSGSGAVLILLGEPGSGKSFELDLLRRHVEADGTRSVRYLDLGKYADAGVLASALRRSLGDCMVNSTSTTLFLDALDECRVNIKRAETIVEETLKEASPDALRVVIVCRTPAWPGSLEAALTAHWHESGNLGIKVYEIAPYSRDQVVHALKADAIDSERFFEALDTADAHGLALQPLGLRFLISQFKEGSTFPASRWSLYERGCKALIRMSERRREDGRGPFRDANMRLGLAAFVGACAMLTNRTKIVLDQDPSEINNEMSLNLVALVNHPMQSETGEWRPTWEDFAEILDTGLFITINGGAFGFAHRTYAEFLAAYFINAQGLASSGITRIVTLAGDSLRLVPQLRELAAWLAQQSDKLLEFVIDADPSIVFDSSVLLTDPTKTAAVFDALLRLILERKYPVYRSTSSASLSKLAHPGLLNKARLALLDNTSDYLQRVFVTDVATASDIVKDIAELPSVVLDPDENYEVRQRIAYAIRESGAEVQKRHIVALLNSDLASDPDDELKGIALACAMDLGTPVGTLIANMQPQKKPNLTGAYARAMREMENANVTSQDVPPILHWLASHLGPGASAFTWEDFVFHMFSKTVYAVMQGDEHWDTLGKVAWLALSNHHRLSTSRTSSAFDRQLQFADKPDARRSMFECMLTAADADPRAAAGLLRFGTGLLAESDGEYLVARYEKIVANDFERRVLAHLIVGHIYDADGSIRDYILDRAGVHSTTADKILYEAAADYIATVQLDSNAADSARRAFKYRQDLENPNKADPGIRSLDLLLAALARADNGSTREWINIAQYLRYEDSFTGFYNLAPELSASPLWNKLDDVVRSRLLELALEYLQANSPVAQLAPHEGNRIDDVGVAVLVLLYSSEAGRFPVLPDLLLKWIRAVTRYNRDEQPRAVLDDLLLKAVAQDEEAVIPVLVETCERFLRGGHASLPPFVRNYLPARLKERLELLLPTLERDDAFLTLADFLIRRDSPATARLLTGKAMVLPDLATTLASESVALLARHAPQHLVDSVWPRLEAQPAALDALGVALQLTFPSGQLPFLRTDAGVTETVFEILTARHPSSGDLPSNGQVTRLHQIQAFRDACLYNLRDWATEECILALGRILQRHPELPWIGWMIHDAELKLARDAWVPFDERETLTALGITGGTIVRTGDELRSAVVKTLEQISAKLSAAAEHPSVYFLWDEHSGRPKHEPRLCDWLANELRTLLTPRGAIVNREVQVRSHNPKGVGERTDILIEAIGEGRNASTRAVRVVIEVKGCWNDDLLTAPSEQLRDNYMRALPTAGGIYLVMWFLCARWSDVDRRKRKTQRLVPEQTIADCRKMISTACGDASTTAAVVIPFVIDCTY
jgi:hypothetical protein